VGSAPKKPAPTGRRSVTAIVVERDLCKTCGICSELCEARVFDTDEVGYPVVARLADCTACLYCERHCPDFAITVVVARGRDKAAKPTARHASRKVA
jgi:2-oxoglutarate ferredoxin oxidoreductase subunit delta